MLYYEYPKLKPIYSLQIETKNLDKNKKATINPVNRKGNKCFQWAVTIALNHEKIGSNHERITKTKSFINKYNWEEITFPSEKDDWKKFEKNNVTIALNILYAKKEKKYILILFQKITREKQLIISMIPSEGACHYLTIKKYQHY